MIDSNPENSAAQGRPQYPGPTEDSTGGAATADTAARETRSTRGGGDAIRAATGRRVRIALFDLDQTLIPTDSDYEWGQFTIGLGWNDPVEFKRRNDAFFAQYRAGTLDLTEYVRFATRALREQGATKSIAARARFMRENIEKVIKSEALALIASHRAAGDTLVIVTATNEFVTRPIADAFGVSDLIAVELETDAAGALTGEIKGTPSFREGKVTRVAQWLAAQGLDWTMAETVFYSDSMNDLPLLEQVTHPVATNPDPHLRALATERGWRILDLF